jgi:hypothetical protein
MCRYLQQQQRSRDNFVQLRDCDLEDGVLLSVVRGMSQLQRLDVRHNLLLADAALAAVTAELTQLN